MKTNKRSATSTFYKIIIKQFVHVALLLYNILNIQTIFFYHVIYIYIFLFYSLFLSLSLSLSSKQPPPIQPKSQPSNHYHQTHHHCTTHSNHQNDPPKKQSTTSLNPTTTEMTTTNLNPVITEMTTIKTNHQSQLSNHEICHRFNPTKKGRERERERVNKICNFFYESQICEFKFTNKEQ